MKPPVSDFPLKASMQEAQEAFEQESFDDLLISESVTCVRVRARWGFHK